MKTRHRIRPLFTLLALIALLLMPWQAEAAPTDPIESLTGWLTHLWAHVGLILDPDGVAAGELVSTPAEGLILDPNGGASIGGNDTPPAGMNIADEGCIWDPSGGACRGDR